MLVEADDARQQAEYAARQRIRPVHDRSVGTERPCSAVGVRFSRHRWTRIDAAPNIAGLARRDVLEAGTYPPAGQVRRACDAAEATGTQL